MNNSGVKEETPPSNINLKSKKERRGGPHPHPKGFFGRSMKKTSITINDVIVILGARLKWCHGKIDLHEGEDLEIRYLDNLSKLAGPLMQAFKLRGIEVKDEQDLAKIFEEIAKRREGKKAIRFFIEEL